MIARSIGALTISGAVAAAGCTTAVHREAAPAYPLLDGRCNEYQGLGAAYEALPHDVTLFLFQDESYVWLCASLPPNSFGTADIVISAPALESPVNLHVSAQIGEWPANDPDAAPKTSESDLWWRVSGWYAVPVRMNGYVEDEAGRRARFIPSEGRELQLAKERFGRGEWRMNFTLRAVTKADGERTSISYPAEDDDHFSLIVD